MIFQRSQLKIETYKPMLLRNFSAKLNGRRSKWVATQTLRHEPFVLIGIAVLKICQFVKSFEACVVVPVVFQNLSNFAVRLKYSFQLLNRC